MDPKTLDQARAMVTWGDEPDEVRRFLLSNDVSSREVEECLALLKAERHREIRWSGFRMILIGIACLAVSVVGFYYLWPVIQTRRRSSWLLTVLIAFGGFGIWKFVDGLIYLIRPQLESKAISEIAE
jgi:hypothetical protein